MDQLAAIRAFLAVTEEGGFAPAARRLGVATSSLTRQVDGLEAHLGTQLLNRSTRRVTLTPGGEHYRQDAATILDALTQADRAVAEAGGRPSGRLRVSVPVAFARLHLAPALHVFLAEHPEVQLELLASDTVINLVEDRIDLAIRLGPPGEGSLIARRLAPHRRILCAAPDYLTRRGRPAHPDDLADHACLTFTQATDHVVWHFRGPGGEAADVAVEGPLRATNSELLLAAGLRGAGVLLMPDWLVGGAVRDGRLEALLPGWHPPEGAIHAVYLPNRRGSAKVAAFVAHLSRTLPSTPERPPETA